MKIELCRKCGCEKSDLCVCSKCKLVISTICKCCNQTEIIQTHMH